MGTQTGNDIDIFLKQCPRFRVLIMGKANAGKTTILQKMCQTTEAPIVRDSSGKLVSVFHSLNSLFGCETEEIRFLPSRWMCQIERWVERIICLAYELIRPF